MSWEKEIEELKLRQALAKKMGGEEKVARHVNAGKLTVRDRIDKILDDGSFEEVGSVTGKAEYDADGNLVDMQPANLITGRGRVKGRRVVIAGDDFTVRGGANDAGIREKLRAEKITITVSDHYMRVAVSVFNDANDIEKLVRALS